MLRREVWWKFTDNSAERITSIFRVEASGNLCMLLAGLTLSPEFQAACSPEMAVNFHPTTWRNIPENSIFRKSTP
jgi:hypothetical protein